MRVLPKLAAAVLLAAVAAACGGSDSPTTPTPAPIPQANVALAPGAQLSLAANCDALRQLGNSVGVRTSNCQFSFNAINNGGGCASNVRGTVTSYSDQALTQQVGTASFSYAQTLRVGETFVATGSGLSVLNSGTTYYRQPTFAWDNVRC